MTKEETTQFFAYLGEIWRDINLIEFLMRCAIARCDGEIEKFPKPPYTKGRIYQNPPKSFLHYSLENVIKKFTTRFPQIPIPKELIDFRHAMAHGVIVQINNSGIEELIKFKDNSNGDIAVEFNLPLEITRLKGILESLYVLKRHIMELAKD